jgi:hypothetical protein
MLVYSEYYWAVKKNNLKWYKRTARMKIYTFIRNKIPETSIFSPERQCF